MRVSIHGILLLNKPPRMTSNAALQRVKHLFRAKKAGHTGSLDPIATGMLPICFGEATKFSQFLLDSDKSYRVVATLGVRTRTGDSEGEIIATEPVHDITINRLSQVMAGFQGDIQQIPPMYSALKHHGQPLYKLARQGIEIERKPRKVTLFSLTLETVDPPQFSFHVHCSKGTYIRTLVEDIGNQLGCGAHVTALHRTTVTPYGHATMYTWSHLETMARDDASLSACLLPIETAVNTFPVVTLSVSSAFYLRQGQSVRTTITPTDQRFVRLISEEEKFMGIGEVTLDGYVKPYRLLAEQSTYSR